jgi:hypothetical protein
VVPFGRQMRRCRRGERRHAAGRHDAATPPPPNNTWRRLILIAVPPLVSYRLAIKAIRKRQA